MRPRFRLLLLALLTFGLATGCKSPTATPNPEEEEQQEPGGHKDRKFSPVG